MESPWSPEQNKAFEQALALFDDAADVERWEKIANYVEGKSAAEVIRHYEKLLQDVEAIECGMVPLPKYSATSFMPMWLLEQPSPQPITATTTAPPSRAYEQERKKGVPWTEEEHRKFLLGLKKYGKGDWRSISRNFVVSRTPTQVASHAQKYFLRLSSGNKEKKRSSIHDITSAGIAEIKQQDNAVATSPPSATSGPPQNMGFPSSPSSPLGANMTNPVVPQIESGHGMFPPNTSGSYQTNGFEPHPLKHGAPNSAMFCVPQVDMSGNPDAYYVGNLMSRD